MERIKEIHINNFKFFPESKPIQIDGKNILLYGENGSGKSSIYWGLYTLLECSEKDDPTQIKKYFNKKNDENLINIHAEVDEDGVDNSFIKITMLDETEFEISHQNTSINTNELAKESLLASDFLNYRILQQSHNVRHSQEIDLFPLFREAVLNYVQFSPVNWHKKEDGKIIQLTNAGSIYKIVEKGPEKKYKRKSGDNGYPTKKSYKKAFDEFKDLTKGFHNGLINLIQKINDKAYLILINKLGYNISFHLEIVIEEEQKLTVTKYTAPKYKIRLIIDDFEGAGKIIKPQSFLNEARLSAIALSIRLAILEERLSDAKVKILVLDDLMISLDMSNRDKVVKLILEEYAWWNDGVKDKGHQTFILTHDRSLFTFIRHSIENLPNTKKDTWKLIEMYVKDVDETIPGDFEKPIIFYNQNEFSIAFRHYKNHDYPASANYLRKYAEKILCDWLPEYYWKDKESSEKSNKKIPLRNIIDNAINVFWPSFGIDCPEYKELRKYVGVLLNPLSHADVGVDRYKEEIKQVILLLEKIKKLQESYKLETIIAGGEKVQFRKEKEEQTYIVEYELAESIYKLQKDTNIVYSNSKGKADRYEMLDNIGNKIKGSKLNGNKISMKKNYDDFISKNDLISSENWFDDLFKPDGSKFS